INAKQLVANGLGLVIAQNIKIKEKNTEYCIKQNITYTEKIDFLSYIPVGAEPFLIESSVSYGYVINLNGKFIIHTSHEKNEVQKCLGTKVIPYLLENTENTASEEEISLTGLSDVQLATFPIKNQKTISFCIYKIGKEVCGRIIVNKGSPKKSEKYMDKLFDRIEKWANGDYLRKEQRQVNKQTEKQTRKSLFSFIFPSKKDSKAAVIQKSAILICVVAIISAISFFGFVRFQSYSNNKDYTELASLYGKDADLSSGYPDDFLPEFASLYNINDSITGYVRVLGTNIDYPVVQEGDDGYYFTHNFSGEKSKYGVPFLDYEVDLVNSKNFIVYGNNMKDGQMFADIVKYSDLSFYKEHPVIEFDNVYEKGTYKIVSVFRATANKSHKDIFNYQSFVNPMDDDETTEFLDEITKRSLIKTDIDYNEDDDYLTISTDTDEFDGAKFVVVARKVRTGESSVVNTAKSSVNKKPLMPDIWYTLFGGTKPVFDEVDEIDEIDENPEEIPQDEETTPQEDETQQNTDNTKVQSVKLNQNEGMLYVGVSYKLSANVYPENATNKNVVWKSDNEEIVTTDENGRITAISEGVANITASSEDGDFSDSCKIYVKTDGVKVTGISLDKSQGNLKKGQTMSIVPTITPADAKNKAVLFESSNNKIATVDKLGNITAVGVGTAKITAQTEDGGKTATFNLTVNSNEIVADEVVLNKERLELNIGDNYHFTAKVYPENATNKTISFESSNTNIVAVYSDGSVEAKKEGKSTIKAFIKGTDAFAECIVNVLP
ncbi:MAG: class B sortase, partial [Oscillospiraceae bacterium]